MKNKVSILMTVYNAEKYLKQSIYSVINQTYKNWELIIVDDCSTDKSLSIIKRFKNKKFRIFPLKKKIGRTKALNFGLKKIKGNYVAILDADDISNKKRIETQINFFKKNNKDFLVGSWYKIIDKHGKFVKLIKTNTDINKIYEKMTVNNIFCHSSIMFRKKLLFKIGGYPKELTYSQDYGFILKSMKIRVPKIIPKLLTISRRHDESMTYYNKLKKYINLDKIIVLIYIFKNFKFNLYSGMLWNLRFFKSLFEFFMIKLFTIFKV